MSVHCFLLATAGALSIAFLFILTAPHLSLRHHLQRKVTNASNLSNRTHEVDGTELFLCAVGLSFLSRPLSSQSSCLQARLVGHGPCSFQPRGQPRRPAAKILLRVPGPTRFVLLTVNRQRPSCDRTRPSAEGRSRGQHVRLRR